MDYVSHRDRGKPRGLTLSLCHFRGLTQSLCHFMGPMSLCYFRGLTKASQRFKESEDDVADVSIVDVTLSPDVTSRQVTLKVRSRSGIQRFDMKQVRECYRKKLVYVKLQFLLIYVNYVKTLSVERERLLCVCSAMLEIWHFPSAILLCSAQAKLAIKLIDMAVCHDLAAVNYIYDFTSLWSHTYTLPSGPYV